VRGHINCAVVRSALEPSDAYRNRNKGKEQLNMTGGGEGWGRTGKDIRGEGKARLAGAGSVGQPAAAATAALAAALPAAGATASMGRHLAVHDALGDAPAGVGVNVMPALRAAERQDRAQRQEDSRQAVSAQLLVARARMSAALERLAVVHAASRGL